MLTTLRRVGRNHFYLAGKPTNKIRLNTVEKVEKGILSAKIEIFDSIEDLEIFISENPERIIEHIAEYF